jgi:hypothetical protein
MAYIDDKLGRGEKIIYVGHQHPIVLVQAAIKWFGLFLIALIAAFFIGLQWKPTESWQNTAKTVLVIALSIVALISFVRMFWDYLVWTNDEFIITNERVIKLRGVINKALDDSSLEKVNDVEMRQTAFGRMLGYGTVRIVTGNESGANTFNYLGNPNEFKRAMLDAKNGFYGDASDVARAQQQQQPQGSQQYRQPAPDIRVNPAPRPAPATYREEPPMPYPGGGYQQPQGQPQAGPSRAEIPALIAQLAKLRDEGAITEAEFQTKKNDLLRRM